MGLINCKSINCKTLSAVPVTRVASITTKTLQLVGRARTAEQGLMLGKKSLGKGYTEIAPGVFRSANGLR